MTLRRLLASLLLVLAACSPAGQAIDAEQPAEIPEAIESELVSVESEWEVTSLTLRSGVEAYPWNPPHGLDIDDTDEAGLHLYERDGVRHVHPVGQGQYVLMMLNAYNLTGKAEFLDRAILNLDSLLDASIEHDGATYFPYTFDFPLYGLEELTIHAPWWSGMAQGQILSALVRAYEATGDERYRDAADKTFASLRPDSVDDWPVAEPAVSFVDDEGLLWLEEYSGDIEPAYVLNGHIFAIYGLYDYWELTSSAKAAAMIDGAATAVVHYLPEFRNEPGELSWYGLTIKPNDRGLHAKYHRIHKEQLRKLFEMTGEKVFADYADLLSADL